MSKQDCTDIETHLGSYICKQWISRVLEKLRGRGLVVVICYNFPFEIESKLLVGAPIQSQNALALSLFTDVKLHRKCVLNSKIRINT